MGALSGAKWIFPLLIALCLTACTEEKAKALQLTAQSFSNEADAACAMGADSLKASVAMPARTRADISKSLAGAKKFGAKDLEIIYSDASMVDAGIKPALDALDQACEAHRRLAAIYTDLPRGYLLGADDVRKAQKHVVNVTVRFVRLAQNLASNPTIGRDNAARIRIIEGWSKAMAVGDEKARSPLLDGIAEDILTNQAKEAQNRALVMAQFAKATYLGEKLVQASLDYDRLSVADLLESLREFSSLYGDITGRTAVAQNALERINGVEARITNDPRLRPLLDADLVQQAR